MDDNSRENLNLGELTQEKYYCNGVVLYVSPSITYSLIVMLQQRCGVHIYSFLVLRGLCLEGWASCWGQMGNRLVLHLWRMAPLCLMSYLWRERNAHSFDDCENSLLNLKKLVLQTLYKLRVTWNTLHVSTFSEFLDLCSSLYGLGVILYTSCVLGLRSSALWMNI